MAMEATIFTGWIYDHVLPHADQVNVAHALMLRANRQRWVAQSWPTIANFCYSLGKHTTYNY
jgi:hypothetical protein